jgi:vacuolar-type H+-ATPase subunit E/Vma4
MTYRQLLKVIQNIPDNYLDDDVTIYIKQEDEYFAASGTEIADEATNDVLDPGHLFITV